MYQNHISFLVPYFVESVSSILHVFIFLGMTICINICRVSLCEPNYIENGCIFVNYNAVFIQIKMI